MIRIKDLYVYPVKSCKGVRVDEIRLSPTGFLGDRHWMVVDEHGIFVSQREQPKLALVEPALTEDMLILNVPGMPELAISREVRDGERTEVELFGEKIPSLSAGREASSWFSQYLGGDYRVVACDPEFLRKGGVQYPSRDEAPTSFVDNYGILVISEASREDLNKRLVSGVPMNRFRPNIVVEGVDPYGEDYFASASTTDVTLRYLLSMQPDHHRSGESRIRTRAALDPGPIQEFDGRRPLWQLCCSDRRHWKDVTRR
jgi:uncharacterized protein YcbX